MVDDPAVRSVRVAVALCDRFEELLKGPSKVSAAKANRGIIGVSGNDSELSLRIGEAQQIFPEIWRHLDEARAGFAARGVSVEGYDLHRAGVGVALGAAVQTSYNEVVGPHGHVRTTKDANFNRAGLVRARNACNALMQATPDINWAVIAQAEANDPAAAAFKSATRNKRIMMFGALALVLASPFLYVLWQHHEERVQREKWRASYQPTSYTPPPPAPPTPKLPDAENVAYLKHLAEVRDAYGDAVANWNKTMSPEALAAIKPGADPCSKKVDPPTPTAATDYVENGNTDPAAFASSDFRAQIAEMGPVPVDPIAGTQESLDRIGDRVAREGATPHDVEHLATYPVDVLYVVIDKDTEPKVTSVNPTVYTPGEVIGRGYVFSILQDKVVCAAAIHAKNPPQTSMPKFLTDASTAGDVSEALHRQLEISIRQELAKNLRAVSP